MEKEYPTRNHLPVSTEELDLPETRLNINNRKNIQNHHLFYYSGRYKGHIILNSLRDLEGNQEPLPKDQHVLGKFALHNVYRAGVPVPPMDVAMDRLEQGYEGGERFKVWNIKTRRYEYYDFTDEYWQRLKDVYDVYNK